MVVVDDEEQESRGCCDVFCALAQLCGVFCYISCPPVPSIITNKLAFHPPKKGVTYHLRSKEEPEKTINSAVEVNDENFEIVVHSLHASHHTEFQTPSENIETKDAILAQQVLLFCQPNSSDVGGFLQPVLMNLVNFAQVFEMDVYAFDYSGYGYSTGSPCEKNIYADVRAVYQHIREKRPEMKIVLMGFSIGTTAAVDLASSNPDGLAGVILVAPFTSGLRLMSSKPTKKKSWCVDSFRSYDKVNKINARVLICHGDKDEVIPIEHGMALHQRLKNPVTVSIIHGANHQTILSGRYSQTFTRIFRFLKDETEVNGGNETIESISGNPPTNPNFSNSAGCRDQ
ncbi:unnamed protein product [Caenorhabditis auriculariae]|uniref:Serine aminopeptidase S33 domain-containing protein n=1 Tax=Caenorhabditis auriculariae TaxID=2777116 RepID=A0A8S1H7Q0_9PELO|nr:unnamed protein product [Caenorhabditis auriculariae]